MPGEQSKQGYDGVLKNKAAKTFGGSPGNDYLCSRKV